MLTKVDLRSPLGVRDYCFVELLAHCGLRVGELVGLNVSDCHYNGQARFRLFVWGATSKGHKGRIVPLNRIALSRSIDSCRSTRRGFSVAAEAPLFVSKSHRRMTTRAVQYIVADLRERAGIAVPLSPHICVCHPLAGTWRRTILPCSSFSGTRRHRILKLSRTLRQPNCGV